MTIVNYIKENCWCDFKNNNRSLFYRSIYNYGIRKYKQKIIENEVTETITFYYPSNSNQIHGFNGNQPPIHENTLQKIKIEDLNQFIKKYNKIREKIEKISLSINQKKKFFKSKEIKKIIELEAEIYSFEYFISNFANKRKIEKNKKVYSNFIEWKNNPNNKEPWIYNKVFDSLINYYKLDISITLFKQYIHFQELIEILDGKIDIHILVNKIKKREKNGCILLNFKSHKNKIIINSNITNEIKRILENKQTFLINKKSMHGKPTFPFGILEGECIVLKNNRDFQQEEIFNKIVVCSVLTVEDTIKLMDSRCILVEYGGYLSHASIWSREYNKPCLIGCQNISNLLHTGDIIIIDGENGCIHEKTTF